MTEKSLTLHTKQKKTRSGRNERFYSLMTPVVALILALVVSSIFIALAGVDPLYAYEELFKGAFGSYFGITESIMKASPLILTGLAFGVAGRCGIWNIGAEGQLQMGALASVLVGLVAYEWSPWIGIPTAIIAGAFFGAVWGAIPGLLKAYLKINEIISTIMMNYIAIQIVGYMVHGPLLEPPGFFPESAILAESVWYPRLLGTRIHFGFLLAVLIALLLFFLLWYTPFGFKLRAVGLNPSSAEYAGINIKWSIVMSMVISGAAAGLAGTNEMLGIHHRLLEGFSPGFGGSGIAVALLGQNHPIGIILAGILFSGMKAGAAAMQRAVSIPVAIVDIMQGLVVLFIVASMMVPKLIAWARARKGE